MIDSAETLPKLSRQQDFWMHRGLYSYSEQSFLQFINLLCYQMVLPLDPNIIIVY